MPVVDNGNLPSICFDEDNRIRVLDAEKFKHTEELQHESTEFVAKTNEFSQIVSEVLQIMESQAKKIEQQKLQAIGQRNRVEGEVSYRIRQKAALQALINEKAMEYERLQEQCESLEKVEKEQENFIDRLSNNEA